MMLAKSTSVQRLGLTLNQRTYASEFTRSSKRESLLKWNCMVKICLLTELEVR